MCDLNTFSFVWEFWVFFSRLFWQGVQASFGSAFERFAFCGGISTQEERGTDKRTSGQASRLWV